MSMMGSGFPAPKAVPRTAAPSSAAPEAVRNSRLDESAPCTADILHEKTMILHRLPTRLLMVASFVLALGTFALGGAGMQSSPTGRPWPPGVLAAPDRSSPLAPDEALKTFYMPPGYRLELVASEALIQEPVAIDWGTD